VQIDKFEALERTGTPLSSRSNREIAMQRREFVTSALATVGGIAAISQQANAAPEDALENIVFTQAQPGHWKAVEALHVPVVTISGDKMTVRTPHPMSEPHYIVSHTIVLEGSKFLGRKTFNWKDQPISEHTLPAGYKGRVMVTSTCNQHDWWLKEVTV
jgi:superoxide reductase